MNLFSSRAFLEIAGGVFFPERRQSIELFRLEGRVLRLLVVDGRPVRVMPAYDFPQPLDGVPAGETVQPLGYFPRTVLRTELMAERVGDEPRGIQPSPFIDWSGLPSFEAWEAMVRDRVKVKGNDNARQVRRLEKDFGPVKFELDDRRPEVFDAIMRWKSAQYLATGVGDLFAQPANVELFRRLHRAGLLLVSSYSAGSTLLAGHFGANHDRRLGFWIPAYDAQFGKYSPGRLLLLELIRASQQRGDVEFDFLIGAEDYKFQFATHNRVVGPVGTPSLREQVVLTARQEVRKALANAPQLASFARQLKRRLTAP